MPSINYIDLGPTEFRRVVDAYEDYLEKLILTQDLALITRDIKTVQQFYEQDYERIRGPVVKITLEELRDKYELGERGYTDASFRWNGDWAEYDELIMDVWVETDGPDGNYHQLAYDRETNEEFIEVPIKDMPSEDKDESD